MGCSICYLCGYPAHNDDEAADNHAYKCVNPILPASLVLYVDTFWGLRKPLMPETDLFLQFLKDNDPELLKITVVDAESKSVVIFGSVSTYN